MLKKNLFPQVRLRRLRQNPLIRTLIKETELNLNDLILPLFIKGNSGDKTAISSMPGHFQIPLNKLEEEIQDIKRLGLNSIILFGIPSHKDPLGSESYCDEGIIQMAIKKIKEIEKNILIIADVCLCEYTDHGACGILSDRTGSIDVDNDTTLELLVKQAISFARAGVDVIAPSGMMDGMVLAIRNGLDEMGFEHIPILSYSVKYNSSLYGPFRCAAEGAPNQGDRTSHQMDPANGKEALREALQDIQEGADMLMVKPAHTYMDIIYRIKEAHPSLPLGAYHTSGEFCMIKAASDRGWIDEKKGVMEVLTSLRRAGADFIITYYAKEVAQWFSIERGSKVEILGRPVSHILLLAQNENMD